MSLQPRIVRWATLAVAVALVAIAAQPPSYVATGRHEPPLLPRKEVLEVLGASQPTLVVDVLWVEMLQTITLASTPEEYRDIYDYASLIADLEPQFRPVYVLSGAAIAYRIPETGEWKNTRESTDMLERGFRAFPNFIYLRTLLAHNLAFFEHDNLRAAKLLEETSKMRGAPAYLGPLAVKLYERGGATDASLALAQSLTQATNDPGTRKVMELRVKQIEQEKLFQQVNLAVDRFKDRNGRLPDRIEELIADGELPGVPIDPLGGRIILGHGNRAEALYPTTTR